MTHVVRQNAAWQWVVVVLPVLLAWLLIRVMPEPSPSQPDPQLQSIAVSDAAELEAVFAELDYYWPPAPASNASSATQTETASVPAIAVQAMPVDLDALTVAKRKTLFFRILAPLVAAENRHLREQREFLERTFAAFETLPEAGPAASRVRAIASRFNVGGNLDRTETRAMLLRRVDIVPAALVLAQAANESGWGTSRFAREANNLFGMWTWDRKSGIAPKRRASDARHFVRVFDDLGAAVKNYLHTINVGPAYRELRDRRAAQRARGELPDAIELAAGLTRYSARGEEYVSEIREIIEYNGLHDLPTLELQREE